MNPNLINPSLDNILLSLEFWGNPQNQYKSIHIVGTNGKGSVANFLALFYERCLPNKFKVGKYTSPHILSPTERVSIDGININIEDYERLSKSCLERSPYQLSAFELETLIAFRYFAEQEINIAILEAGLGARWDATNTTDTQARLATVLTNIGLDHQNYLGNTLEKIRKEKEAIKRDGVPHFEGKESYANSNPNAIDGVNFQLALEVFEKLYHLKIPNETQKQIIDLFPSRYQGRFYHNQEKQYFMDAAHNPHGMQVFSNWLKNFQLTNKIFLIGFLDKDYKSCLDILLDTHYQDGDYVILTKIDDERSCDIEKLSQYCQRKNWAHISFNNTKEALTLAEELQSRNKASLIITGSIKLLTEVLKQN